jgi:hypothetical protein
MAIPNERRKRSRIEVCWTVRFWGGKQGKPIECTTRDVSNQGFYCVSAEPLAAGNAVECLLLIPAQDRTNRDAVLCLACHVQVVRMEILGREGPYGIACQIEDYHVLRAEHRFSA